jgi:hypothetical protein
VTAASPAYEGYDGENLLRYPDQAELEPGARALVEQLQTVIADTSEFALASSEPEGDWFADDNWHPQGGNGYGGDSMLITVNCCDFSSDGVHWIFITIEDGALDPTGDAVNEAKKFGWPVASNSFGYGATVVPTGQVDEYTRALDPFLGLEQPTSTSPG